MTATTLTQALRLSAEADTGVTYLSGDASETRVLYADLYRRALRILSELQQRGQRGRGDLHAALLQRDANPPGHAIPERAAHA